MAISTLDCAFFFSPEIRPTSSYSCIVAPDETNFVEIGGGGGWVSPGDIKGNIIFLHFVDDRKVCVTIIPNNNVS